MYTTTKSSSFDFHPPSNMSTISSTSSSSLSHKLSNSTLSLLHDQSSSSASGLSLHHKPSSSTLRLKHKPSTSTLRLKHKPSQLDLIDSTTFTSLPLPPPKKFCGNSRAAPISTTVVEIEDEKEELNIIEDYFNPGGAVVVGSGNINNNSNSNNNTAATIPNKNRRGQYNNTKENRLYKIFKAVSYKYNI
ncbi:hypothetical protein G210_5646 [Candida maltosa Xu316]|uniref:Uncharacterized protein n=1 Tax=Candida maltosa (strain Xu316) TaxID=1245528 RepID=M3JFD1_CANMX|nr:hypothetical protein G210_5646 [Candida maltosa Xu316]